MRLVLSTREVPCPHTNRRTSSFSCWSPPPSSRAARLLRLRRVCAIRARPRSAPARAAEPAPRPAARAVAAGVPAPDARVARRLRMEGRPLADLRASPPSSAVAGATRSKARSWQPPAAAPASPPRRDVREAAPRAVLPGRTSATDTRHMAVFSYLSDPS